MAGQCEKCGATNDTVRKRFIDDKQVIVCDDCWTPIDDDDYIDNEDWQETPEVR